MKRFRFFDEEHIDNSKDMGLRSPCFSFAVSIESDEQVIAQATLFQMQLKPPQMSSDILDKVVVDMRKDTVSVCVMTSIIIDDYYANEPKRLEETVLRLYRKTVSVCEELGYLAVFSCCPKFSDVAAVAGFSCINNGRIVRIRESQCLEYKAVRVEMPKDQESVERKYGLPKTLYSCVTAVNSYFADKVGPCYSFDIISSYCAACYFGDDGVYVIYKEGLVVGCVVVRGNTIERSFIRDARPDLILSKTRYKGINFFAGMKMMMLDIKTKDENLLQSDCDLEKMAQSDKPIDNLNQVVYSENDFSEAHEVSDMFEAISVKILYPQEYFDTITLGTKNCIDGLFEYAIT